MEAVEQGLKDNTFVKLSLGNYKGQEEQLKNIYIKRVLIKQEEKLSFTYRYKTRDMVKNYSIAEALELVQGYMTSGFLIATVLTTGFDLIYEQLPNKKIVLRRQAATQSNAPSLEHDKAKHRLISPLEKPYLYELNITDNTGKVLKHAQDKYRQINHYVDILSSLIKEIPPHQPLKVADMGSGKGYLTFALYDYLSQVLKLEAQVTGVEFRPDLVELCNTIARKAHCEQLNFVEGTIEQYDSQGTNILIALHACDTATDDAIAKGISAEADLIVVAPCCHKQIRRQIEQHKASNQLDFLTKHGIFLERQAEMVTDGLRAMILEYFGYKTKVFEFISDVHTPKNVLVVGIKKQKDAQQQAAILQKIKDTKAYFGIEYHHLERIMGLW